MNDILIIAVCFLPLGVYLGMQYLYDPSLKKAIVPKEPKETVEPPTNIYKQPPGLVENH